jgi:hypothetical protein
VTLKYFAIQPKLFSKQVRWQDTLALFNVDIRHKPGNESVVPDALSRKHQLKVVYVGETKLQKELSRKICQGNEAKHSKWNQVYRNPTLGLNVRRQLTLPKVGKWSPPGLSKTQKII